MAGKFNGTSLTLAALLSIAGASPSLAQNPASVATRAAQAEALAAAASDAAAEAAEDAAARRGFIAAIPDGLISDASGAVVWDWRPFAFLSAETAPDTVNPRLWRQARRNAVHGLFEVVPGSIWQVRGYDISVMTIIRGETGWIVVDPLTTEQAAAAAMSLVRQHLGDRPVRAVIFSHSHADHFGGVGGIVSRADVARGGIEVIAPHGFVEEAVSENVLAGPAMNNRAAYMFGTGLAAGPMGQVDTGLGPRIAGGTIGFVSPNVIISSAGETRTVDGVELQFLDAANTEAPAELVFYIPRDRAIHTTEVVTKTLHNFLTLRGALVRDALRWSQIIDRMHQRWGDEAEVQLASHGWPTFGGDAVRAMLSGQRDQYRFIHDRTLNAANNGATIQELPDIVEGAEGLTIDPTVRGYYGTVNHNSKAVYQRYFGWWDGVPANFDPLPPAESARGYVELAGGPVAMLAAARAAQDAGNHRWAAQLFNHLVFAQPDNAAARAGLADAYEQLGYQAESGAWRNYYLAAAARLRGVVPQSSLFRQQSADFVAAIPTLDLFNALATRLTVTAPVAEARRFRFIFTDSGEVVTVEQRGIIEIPRIGPSDAAALAEVRMTRAAFGALLGGQARMADMVASGQIALSGDVAALQGWLAAHRPPTPDFPIVTP